MAATKSMGPAGSTDPGRQWDQRFTGDEYVYGEEPNLWLTAQAGSPSSGRNEALAIGDGEGRNGVWLAEQGWSTLSVDASAVGLEKARRLAERRGVPLATEQAALEDWSWPRDRFALAASIFVHLPPSIRPAVHRSLSRSLAPGGLLVLEAFLPRQLANGTGGPKSPELLYTATMLRDDFDDLEILHLEEKDLDLNEGRLHRGPSAVVRLLARRPVL